MHTQLPIYLVLILCLFNINYEENNCCCCLRAILAGRCCCCFFFLCVLVLPILVSSNEQLNMTIHLMRLLQLSNNQRCYRKHMPIWRSNSIHRTELLKFKIKSHFLFLGEGQE
jgi:hypothetical protein